MSVDHYASARPLIGTVVPTWCNSVDAIRLASYDLYDNIYRNNPDTYALVQQGSDNNPIYIPSARGIIEACNRYLLVQFDYGVNGDDSNGKLVKAAMDKLFRRERFKSTVNSVKRNMVKRGDAVIHVTADRLAAPGRRISITEIHPANYFPISDPDDVTNVVGVYIATLAHDPTDPNKQVVQRTTYWYPVVGATTSATVWTETDMYETGAWDDRINSDTGKPFHEKIVKVASVIAAQDTGVRAIPVYHFRNRPEANEVFGWSEVSGMETALTGINQATTDEELSLALDGLGVYFTTAGAPKDADGNDTNWELGPGKVVEGTPNSTMSRVSGTTNVTPFQDHLKWLTNSVNTATATPEVALGVGQTIAESGIALLLRFSPLLAKNGEKETEMIATFDNMYFDLLNDWMPTFEPEEDLPEPETVDLYPTTGDPMPVDRAAVIAEVVQLVTAQLWTIEQGQAYLKLKLGMEFDLSSPDQINKQARELAEASDPFGSRLAAELDAPDTGAGA